ncbi:MAG: hypothetical protein AB1758_03840 [Candidatus Eremiobacterota bacterium]
MEIRTLSRDDFLATARALRQNPDLAQRAARDEELFQAVPGDSLGEMSDRAQELWVQHGRNARQWAWGAAGLTFAGGVTTFSLISSHPLAAAAVGLAAAGGVFWLHRQSSQHRRQSDTFLDASMRLDTWERVLGDVQRRIDAEEADARAVTKLVEGLQQTGTAILVDETGVRVGAVRLKRKA